MLSDENKELIINCLHKQAKKLNPKHGLVYQYVELFNNTRHEYSVLKKRSCLLEFELDFIYKSIETYYPLLFLKDKEIRLLKELEDLQEDFNQLNEQLNNKRQEINEIDNKLVEIWNSQSIAHSRVNHD